MRTKKGTQLIVTELSPLTYEYQDEAGKGLLGFTATFNDGSFKNITRAFNPETHAAVKSELASIKRTMECSLVKPQTSEPLDIMNYTNHNCKKRRRP
jgi:hypothetical protein